MKEKGIYNVRGGIYCNVALTEDEVNTIGKLIASTENKCYKCGGNHFAKSCDCQPLEKVTRKKRVQEHKSLQNNNYKMQNFQNISKYDFSCESDTSSDDTEDDCYVTVWCCSFCGKQFDTYKGATCHENLYCGKNISQKGTTSRKKAYGQNKSNKCYKCGRKSHYANDCYASTYINGYPLN